MNVRLTFIFLKNIFCDKMAFFFSCDNLRDVFRTLLNIYGGYFYKIMTKTRYNYFRKKGSSKIFDRIINILNTT